jgi:hypothetical protein
MLLKPKHKVILNIQLISISNPSSLNRTAIVKYREPTRFTLHDLNIL